MTATLTTKQIKDGAGNVFQQRVLDVSGTGAGPFLPLYGVSDQDGAGPIDIAALVDTITAAIAAGAAGAATATGQSALGVQIGEVQAEPTTNTVLSRLKAIATGLGSVVLATGTSVIGKVGLQIGGSDINGGNPLPVTGGQVSVFSASIAAAGTLSGAVDLGLYRLCRIVMPASWTAAVLTFQTSPDGTNWYDLYDAGGSEYTVQAGAGRGIVVPLSDFLGTRYLKIRSGTSGAAVAQSGGASFTLVGAA
ncbi:hypothetical protein SAMN02745157_2287 [Kaistia soli DSM 19436]|uniref:Uncharacterized protein n=1 Tax=Kaistia soli DSM 19436 TaxID=1122133 RepID=A0A1M5CB77_9HYPH|nr:hypothetical protein [Kaistia soli]SHF52013.1 hypothetical protein SAMN02745157_2287 [Kaistia soli DSM 19436]